jgi:hypothetical protein
MSSTDYQTYIKRTAGRVLRRSEKLRWTECDKFDGNAEFSICISSTLRTVLAVMFNRKTVHYRSFENLITQIKNKREKLITSKKNRVINNRCKQIKHRIDNVLPGLGYFFNYTNTGRMAIRCKEVMLQAKDAYIGTMVIDDRQELKCINNTTSNELCTNRSRLNNYFARDKANVYYATKAYEAFCPPPKKKSS